MIFLENITVSYNKRDVLKNFSLTLPERGIVCLFAPSGSGKTTLLKIISGLQQNFTGSIAGLKGKQISVVFQENRLLEGLTAKNNISIVLPRGEKASAVFWLEQVGLRQAADLLPGELSGGMQRRLAIARALAWGGDVYLLDEPFQGLDEAIKIQVMNAIRRRAAGDLVILVTHSRENALIFADQVVVCSGQPMKVKRQFFLQEPYGSRNMIDMMDKYGEF